MSKVKVHSGDFLSSGVNSFHFFAGQGSFTLASEKHKIMGEKIDAFEIEEIDVASEESVKRLWGTAGWGAAGAVALGPVGLLAGLLLGGKGKDVVFVCKFKDGRNLLATTDSKTYTNIQAAMMSASKHPPKPSKEVSMKDQIKTAKILMAVLSGVGVIAGAPSSMSVLLVFVSAMFLFVPLIQTKIVERFNLPQIGITVSAVCLHIVGWMMMINHNIHHGS